MKKIALLLVVVLSVTLLLVACTPKDWDEQFKKDFARLEEAGFTMQRQNTREDCKEDTEGLNQLLSKAGIDKSVKVVKICGLSTEDYDSVIFEEFETEEQAKTMFDYFVSQNDLLQYALIGKVLISTNCEQGVELLDYDFV